MAVSKDKYILPTEEEYSSYEDEDYSDDSEQELGNLNSSESTDLDIENIPSSTHSIRSTNSPPIRTIQIENRTVRYHQPNRDIVDEGLRLYLMFLQQEIIRNSLQAPEFLHRHNRGVPRNLASLRALADQFSTSAQRQWIRNQARTVHLQSLNFHSFTDLLVGLFQEGGVTWERILVLFFFCTDISIRALQEQLTRQFQRIQDWTTRFIRETVCTWVELEGGWGVIFHQSLNHATRIAIFGFCCVGIIALCIYIRNNAVK